jgi:hypothetical protein
MASLRLKQPLRIAAFQTPGVRAAREKPWEWIVHRREFIADSSTDGKKTYENNKPGWRRGMLLWYHLVHSAHMLDSLLGDRWEKAGESWYLVDFFGLCRPAIIDYGAQDTVSERSHRLVN